MKPFKERPITRVHVNQHVIRSNHKHGLNDPVLTAKTYKSNRYANTIRISGPCIIVYRPDDPLPCGAKCWVETTSEVFIDDV